MAKLFDVEFFRQAGRRGGKKGGRKRWIGTTPEERKRWSELAIEARERKRSATQTSADAEPAPDRPPEPSE